MIVLTAKDGAIELSLPNYTCMMLSLAEATALQFVLRDAYITMVVGEYVDDQPWVARVPAAGSMSISTMAGGPKQTTLHTRRLKKDPALYVRIDGTSDFSTIDIHFRNYTKLILSQEESQTFSNRIGLALYVEHKRSFRRPCFIVDVDHDVVDLKKRGHERAIRLAAGSVDE